MPPIEPFWFKTATVWHKAIFLTRETETVIGLCGKVASYSRRNRKYEDTETRPYAGAVCKRCDTNEPLRVMQRSSRASTQEKSTSLPDDKLSFRKGETVPRPDEENTEVQSREPDTGPGYSYDDAVRRKPRRILP